VLNQRTERLRCSLRLVRLATITWSRPKSRMSLNS
jgi:hypothetical protein